MLRSGLAAGALLSAVLSGCAALAPAFPLAAKPSEQLTIINLKTVQTTVDKSLQETVAISFVPPQPMAIDAIEYRFNGRSVAIDEFDLVLETAKLRVGEHTVYLSARGEGKVVQGTTLLTIIESGQVAAPAEDGAGPNTVAAKGSQSAPNAAGPQGAQRARGRSGQPQLGGDKTNTQAQVAIRILYPDE
jgi:hypothetical protein